MASAADRLDDRRQVRAGALVAHPRHERDPPVDALGVQVTVIDKLSYAGNLASLEGLPESRFRFVRGDITDAALVGELFGAHDAVVHYAAESHNDNSLNDPRPFLESRLANSATLLPPMRKSRSFCPPRRLGCGRSSSSRACSA